MLNSLVSSNTTTTSTTTTRCDKILERNAHVRFNFMAPVVQSRMRLLPRLLQNLTFLSLRGFTTKYIYLYRLDRTWYVYDNRDIQGCLSIFLSTSHRTDTRVSFDSQNVDFFPHRTQTSLFVSRVTRFRNFFFLFTIFFTNPWCQKFVYSIHRIYNYFALFSLLFTQHISTYLIHFVHAI